MTASPDKAVPSAALGGFGALVTLLLSQLVAGDGLTQADVVTVLLQLGSAVLAAALVWLVNYSRSSPYKAIVAAAVPLATAVLRGVQTGDVTAEEYALALQGVLAAVWTYRQPRVEVEASATTRLRN